MNPRKGNSLEELMSTVVENNYDDLVAQAASFNDTTRSTDSIAILNIFDSALSDYSGWFLKSCMAYSAQGCLDQAESRPISGQRSEHPRLG